MKRQISEMPLRFLGAWFACAASFIRSNSKTLDKHQRKRKESIVRSIIFALVAVSGITACQTTSVGGPYVGKTHS